MSLILRKACQETLTKVGLGDYHTRVNDTDKNLEIVGPCGQPLFAISGIKFSKCSPADREIDFAAELLEEFFLTHKKDLDAFFTAQANFAAAKEPVIPDNIQCYSNSQHYGVLKAKGWTNSKGEKLSYYSKDNDFEYEQKGSYAEKDLGKMIKDKKNFTLLTKTVKAYAEHRELYNKFSKAKAKVQTCNI